MKKNTIAMSITLMAVLFISLIFMVGCGGNEDFASYMKGQPAMRASIDSQLAILNEDAKGSVQYVENNAEVTVKYYALTQAEIVGEEAEKITERCNIIMQDAVDQFHKDTGGTATVNVIIYGHDAEEK